MQKYKVSKHTKIMRVLETSGRKISSELQGQDRTQSPSPDDASESVASPGNSTGDDAGPSISFGRGRPVSPFHIANLSATATGSLRSETWPSVSSEALMVSLDEPSESSSSQSSPSPTTSAGPITSSGSGRSGDASRSSSVSEDPAAVQRRYRYIRSRIPVRGHSFCSCLDSPNRTEGRFLECLCGEENGSVCEWTWDAEHKSSAAKIQDDLRTVIFHPNFSNGTAAVRGCAPMREGQHFWEIKMITPVYGTNMMVGVGTKDINLEGYSNVFCSFLGQNTESWGLSYQAHFHHGGQIWQYGGMFGQGSLLGIHLDCWNGTLSFYKNRRPLGVACRNLIGKEVYPMLCSTAARSGMRLVRTQSCTSTLQYLCCRKLRQLIPPHMDVMKEIPLPPGLKTYLSGAYGWLLSSVTEPAKPPQDEKEENNPQATEADLDTGNSNIEATTSYQMLSDRDIIFERFVERLSTPPGRVVSSVQDDAEAGTSQQGQGRAGRRRSQSPAPSARVYFEMVPSSSVRSSSTVNQANVSDSEDITDVSVLSSESLAMETGREQVEKSSWMKGSEVPRSEGGACNIEPHNTKVNSSQNSSAGLVQGPYLKRTLRRKRTLADPAEISQAAVRLQEKLDEYDWKSIVTEPPKRQRLEDSKQRNSTSPVSRELTQNKAVTFACEKQSASEPSPATPFSTFCSTSTTTPRPFTPPNGTSTPVTKLSPEDASSSHSSISALNTETFDEEEDTENPKEESDENDTKNDCQL